jgi:hypothetical protein
MFFLFLVNSSYSQFRIEEVLKDGRVEDLEEEELLNVTLQELDSLLLNSLFFSEELKTYRDSIGRYFFKCQVENNKPGEVQIMNNFNSTIIPILKIQSEIITELVVQNINIDSSKVYNMFFWIYVDFGSNTNSISFLNGSLEKVSFRDIVFSLKAPPEYSYKGPLIYLTIKPDQSFECPRCIDECIAYLDTVIGFETKGDIIYFNELEFLKYHHDSFGFFLGEHWELEDDSDLAQYFNKMGIQSIDAMIEIILTSYYRHLKGDPLRLNEQVQALINEE